jgi:hypothetical protein
MKKKLFNISDSIESSALETLTKVTSTAKKMNIDTLVIGATAIDIIFSNVYGIKIHRATDLPPLCVPMIMYDERTFL